jgi:hypothetical protein
VLHKPFIRIDQLFSSNVQGTLLEAAGRSHIVRGFKHEDSSYMAALQFFILPYDRYVIHGSASRNVAGCKQGKGNITCNNLCVIHTVIILFLMCSDVENAVIKTACLLVLRRSQCPYYSYYYYSVFFSVQNLFFFA